MKFLLLVLILMFLSGCQDDLSPESARQLLKQSMEFPVVVTCQWADNMEIMGDSQGRMLGPQPDSAGDDLLASSPEDQDRCLETMLQAGFVTERNGVEFTLGGGAYFDENGSVAVEFPCALAQLRDVTHIAVSGDKAVITFTLEKEQTLPEARSVVDDPNFSCITLIRATWSCDASFTRAGEGWSLQEITGLGCPRSSSL